MKLEEESFYHITAELQKIGEPIGLEFHPFCVGWYNQYLQNKTFALPYPIDTLAFCVISTPKFFESFFLSHMRSVNLQECSQDPFDKCFASVFGNIKEHFRSSDSYEIDVIHDYEVDTRRRPKLLVQTAGHVSGAAYYYQRKDVPDDPWGDRKIYGVSCHPKLGGWFGFRGGLIFKGLEYPLLDMKAPPDVLSREQKIEFLEGYNFHWQEWTFRDVLDTSADKYSQLQKTYFQTKPCERELSHQTLIYCLAWLHNSQRDSFYVFEQDDIMSTVIKAVQTLDDHEERVWALSWNPKGTLLASCSSDKTIRIWGQEGERWICKSTLTDQHQRTVRDVAWSPSGRLLAAASFDSTISIWDRSNGEFECVATLEGHENEVKSVSWSISGEYLATCSRDKTVWVWACEEDDYECASVLSKHTQDVKKVTWHPHTDVLASCSYDDTINVYNEDDDDWNCYDTLSGHSSTVWSIAFNKSGNRLVSCSDDACLKIWQCYEPNNPEGIPTTGNDPTWKSVCTLSGYHNRPIYDVDWNHETGQIVAAGGDNKITLFSENTETADARNEPRFEQVSSFEQAHHQDVNCVKWNPVFSNMFASCSDDMNIKIWRVCDE